MKSRLNFIKAILHNPDIIFLDEPTSGLYPLNSFDMKKIIKAERTKGKSIILTTHNMQDAAELCDKVAFVVDGKIKALDTPHNLIMSKGALAAADSIIIPVQAQYLPAKGLEQLLQTINKVRKQINGYIVSWCVGHLVELTPADCYDEKYAKWRYEDLPILPNHWQYNVSNSTKKQFDVLKKLLKDSRVDTVICATDAGREGELIFRLVYEKAGCKKPIKRLWISSLENTAIQNGFQNLNDGKEYDNLYQAVRLYC